MSEREMTYSQQMTFCGKSRCRKCREGTGHGPYWYGYQTVNGRTTRTYIGKNLPSDIHFSQDEEASQALLRVRLLGPFRLERRAAPRHLWQMVPYEAWSREPAARSLLGYLLSCPGRQAHRGRIRAALWPQMPDEAADAQLECAILTLRQVIESARPRPKKQPLVRYEQEWLLLADQDDIWADIDAFATEKRERMGEDAELPSYVAHLEHRLAFYQGDFFPEEPAAWASSQRQTLRSQYVGMLLDLVDGYVAQEMMTSAVDTLDGFLATDPTNEAVVQRLMIILAHMMRRGEAHQVYQRCAEVLHREHAMVPERATRVLDDALRAGLPLPVPSVLTHLSLQENIAVLHPPYGRSHHTGLMGRDQEWGRVQSLLQMTQHPHLIVFSGEAGIGKTRLAEEFARDLQVRKWNVAWSQAYSQESRIPYHLWTEVLRKMIAQGRWLREAISQQPHVFQPLAALLPELRQVLPEDAFSVTEQEQLRLWEAIHALLILMSERTPLLLVFDDIHWADTNSCALLAYLARRLRGQDIMMISTCRETDLKDPHSFRSLLIDLQREQIVEMIQLQPLSPQHIGDIIAGFSHIQELPSPLVEQISHRANGNPLFAEELTRMIETQCLTSDNVLDGTGLPLPDTIAALFQQRLSPLSLPCQQLLRTAAVFGSSFSLQMINAMKVGIAGLQEETVFNLLEEAIQADILTEDGTGSRITYQFWHPLFQQYLDEGLSTTRRARLHREAAHVLCQLHQHDETEHAAMITHHLFRGGADPERIAYFAELAGHRAFQLSAYNDAEQYYQYAREALERLNTGSQENSKRLSWILIGLGECTRIRGAAEQGRRLYEQALAMREQLPLLSVLVQEQEMHLRALLWCEMGLSCYDTQQLGSARNCFVRGEQLLQEASVKSGPGVARLLYEQGYVSWRRGDYVTAQSRAEEALGLFEHFLAQGGYHLEQMPSFRVTRTLSGDPVDLGRTEMLLGLIANGAGQSKRALNHLNKALTYFEQYDCPRELAIICCNLGDLHMRRGELSQAQAVLRRGLHLAERTGDRPLFAFVTGNLGLVHLRLGSLAEAETLCRSALVASEQMHDEAASSLWEIYVAVVLQEQGHFSQVHDLLLHALKGARATHLSPYIGLALVVLGSLRLRQAMVVNTNDAAGQKRQRQLLSRAKRAIQHALGQEGLEAETRIEGDLVLAEIFLLQGQTEQACAHAIRTRSEAQSAALRGLEARAQLLQGRLCFLQGEAEQADRHCEQAARRLRACKMQLEYARVVYQRGLFLVRQNVQEEKKRTSRGIAYLEEARRVFLACQATFDLSSVEHALRGPGVPLTQ